MILRLVWRSLVRKPGRSLLLLLGYALGVGVTLTLLSIGSALLESSRDRELVGGGDLTVLPRGLDLETFRTGGVSSLYFTVDEAPFLYRQVLAGRRLQDVVAAAAPWMEDQLVYLELGDELRPLSADGVIPGRSAALGVEPQLVGGGWTDATADRRWLAPSDSALYAELDAFHLPPPSAAGDSTWAEWHYFNVLLPGADGWLYLTYMVAGAVPDGRWGGRLLATLVERADQGEPGEPAAPRRGGTHRTGQEGGAESDGWRVRDFRAEVASEEVTFALDRPDLDVGASTVRLGPDGAYRLVATVPPGGAGGPRRGVGGAGEGAGSLRVELELRPRPGRYLPSLEVAGGAFPSGYVVPLLRGRASGRICVGDSCRQLEHARAYHDHNWGVWRDVTWDWGEVDAGPYSLVYGGVRRGGDRGSRFLFLTDSLGFAGLFPVEEIEAAGSWGGSASRGAPTALRILARRGADSLQLQAHVRHARTTVPEGNDAPAAPGDPNAAASSGEAGGSGSGRANGESAGPSRPDAASRYHFHQLFGSARLGGCLRGRALEAGGSGFFETWTRGEPAGTGEGPGSDSLRPRRSPAAGRPCSSP